MGAQPSDDDKALRRDRRKKSARERMAKHGRDLGKVYRDAVLKRTPRRDGPPPEKAVESADKT